MPTETQQAIDWALQQTWTDEWGDSYPVTQDTPQPLVDNVRLYFNNNAIAYSSFSYYDLEPYFN